jgi:prefoldin subunit 5
LQINSSASIESIEADIKYYQDLISEIEIDTDCINYTLDYIDHTRKQINELQQLLKTKKAGLGPCSLSEK